MSDFINTIDLIGDDAAIDSVIQRTCAEFRDSLMTVIGKYAFAGCADLVTIDFPAVTTLQTNAFNNCTSLLNINLPLVSDMDRMVFNGCSSLKEIVFPLITTTSDESASGSGCFANCYLLEKADFTALTSIRGRAFAADYSLKALILRNTETACTLAATTALGNCYHFLGTTNATYNPKGLKDGYIYVPGSLVNTYKAATNWSTYAEQFRGIIDDENILNGVINGTLVDFQNNQIESIPIRAFYNYTPLKSISSDSITSFGEYAFYGCTSLESVDLPNCTSNGSHGFRGCTSIKRVNEPLVTDPGYWTFKDCTGLETASFPSATKVHQYSLHNCTSLRRLEFNNLSSIDLGSFADTPALTALIIRKQDSTCTLKNSSALVRSGIAAGTGYIYVPGSLVNSYRQATNWSTYASQFRELEQWTLDGTVNGELGHRVRFFNHDGTLLYSVAVRTGENAVYTGNEPVREGEWKFKGFVPDGTNVTADMDCYAQYRSTALVSVRLVEGDLSGEYINETVETIGDYAFYDYDTITSVEFPAATSIGECAFQECGNLTTIDSPAVIIINDSAFLGCAKLASIDFPLVTSIGSYAFRNCSTLTSADFPLATTVDTYAFNGCNSLKSANFPAVTTITSYTFQDCRKLTDINFPLATKVSSSSFNGCYVLAIADFPLVTSIGSYAFQKCYSLTALILRSETVCTLSNTNAFTNCYHILGTTNSTYNPNGVKDGYIYVPRALVDSYKTTTNWSTYADQIRAIEDYPDICGGES